MKVICAVLYVIGIALIVLAAVLDRRSPAPRVSLALLGAACMLLGYTLPYMQAAFTG